MKKYETYHKSGEWVVADNTRNKEVLCTCINPAAALLIEVALNLITNEAIKTHNQKAAKG